jgi:tRNA A-37 threonylcarbamoyl transferase component Bud32
MTCLVELPWVGQSLAQARRFILNREPGSQPGKTKKNFGWQDVTAKGAPTAAPVPTGTKEKPAAKVPPKGPTPKKQPSAKPATAKPRINIEREKAEFKKQPTDVLQGLLKYRSQLAPERIKAIESELRGRAKAATPKAAAPKTTAPKQPTAKPARPSELARQAGVSGEREAPRIRELKEVDELAKLGAQALNFGLGKLPGRGEPGGDNPDVVIARLRIRAARNQLRNALRDMGPVGNKDFFKDKDDFEVENMLAVGKWTPRQRLRIEKEMRKRLAGSEKAPGLDVNKPVRVDKKLLAQSPSVLQEVLVQRQNSLNPGQRKKIEAELQRRGIQARPKNKENSFFEADNDFDFASAMRAPGTTIGQGAFGKARLLDRGEVVKEGKIGQYEAAVFNRLRGLGITPELRGVEYRRGQLPKTVKPGYGGHVQELQGKLALERAPGLPWGKQLYNADIPERKQLIDAYLRVRADLHRQGVAHNDMHGGNVFYDKKTGKAMLIDMGLAQISPKAALIEGLGVFNGRDWQADKYDLRGAKTPTVKKLQENIRKVEAELKRLGVDTDRMPQIRANSTKIQGALGKITDSQAQSLVNKLYSGIGGPSVASSRAAAPKAPTTKAPTAKAPTAKAPTAKPSKSTLASESSNSQFRKAIKIADDANLKNVAKFRTALNSVQNRELDKELARRGLQPAAAKAPTTKAPTAKAPTAKAPTAKAQAEKDSFQNPGKDFDFSKERAKPDGSFHRGGAQANDGVVIHRNVTTPNAIKKGEIGQYEVAIYEKLKGAGIAPEVLGVRYDSRVKPETVRGGLGGHIQGRPGELALGIGAGKPMGVFNSQNYPELADKYMLLRRDLHKRGIAHNDMHGGNVMYDPKTGKLTLIDMGLGQISPKAALVEALGAQDGGDLAGYVIIKGKKTPVVQQYLKNADEVRSILRRDYGIQALPGVRTSPEKLNRELGKLTDSEAQKLVDKVYSNLSTPKSAKPAKSTKPASPNRDWLNNQVKGEKTEVLQDFYNRYKGKLKPAVEKAYKDELNRRGALSNSSAPKPAAKPASAKPAAKAPTAKPASGKPKLDTDKMRSNLKKQDDRVLAEVLRQPNLASAQRNLIREEVQRRDLANKVRNDKTAVLERLDRLGEARLGKVKAEVVKAELQRRKANPQAEPPAPTKQQTAQAAKDSFLEAKKPYDFSAADRKPGWVDVGGGAQGEVRLNNNLSQPAAMKNGKVGQYEAAALERLQNVSNVPNLYGVRYDSKQGPQRMDSGLGGSLGPHIRERPGKLAMELKEGKPLYRVMGRDNKDQLTDDLVKARKAIHMRGVAHNDMHGGNVLYDDANKKLNVIDFGLAQISPKAALIEALGGWNARDFQAASMMYRGNGPAVKRYMQNVNNVEAKLKARGLDPDKIPGIRTPMADIDKYFGSMTDSEAQRLIADVYDGI